MANTITNINGAVPGPLVGSTELTQASQSKQAGAAQPAPAQTENQASDAGDEAKLSTLGEALAKATRQASARSAFRPELVAQLKTQVSSGSYKIDMQGLAQTIVGVLGRTGG